MKVGVCEMPADLRVGSPEWTALCRAASREAPDLLLLNEMPFGSWIAAAPSFSAAVWDESCALHDEGMAVLGELGARAVALTRPHMEDGRRVNEAVVWTAAGGAVAVHTKQYFPNEEGFYEAEWFEGGRGGFRTGAVGPARVGFLVCTELMFNEHARWYGREGAHIILAPRAVGVASIPRWEVAMRMAAIVSGCYVLSSNRTGRMGAQRFGGTGWIITPDGQVEAETAVETPVVFRDILLDQVARAQAEYPCYVPELTH